MTYALTVERVAALSRIYAHNAAFAVLAQNYYASDSVNYRIKRKIENSIRAYVSPALADKWAARDARKFVPLLQITDKVSVRFKAPARRSLFNPPRVIVVS